MFAKALIFALAAAGAATAQAQVQNYTSSLDMQLDSNQATAQERGKLAIPTFIATPLPHADLASI